MSTKLDERFVAQALAMYPASSEAHHAINTLANEVRRLEAYNTELEALLTPGQIQAASTAACKKW